MILVLMVWLSVQMVTMSMTSMAIMSMKYVDDEHEDDDDDDDDVGAERNSDEYDDVNVDNALFMMTCGMQTMLFKLAPLEVDDEAVDDGGHAG